MSNFYVHPFTFSVPLNRDRDGSAEQSGTKRKTVFDKLRKMAPAQKHFWKTTKRRHEYTSPADEFRRSTTKDRACSRRSRAVFLSSEVADDSCFDYPTSTFGPVKRKVVDAFDQWKLELYLSRRNMDSGIDWEYKKLPRRESKTNVRCDPKDTLAQDFGMLHEEFIIEEATANTPVFPPGLALCCDTNVTSANCDAAPNGPAHPKRLAPSVEDAACWKAPVTFSGHTQNIWDDYLDISEENLDGFDAAFTTANTACVFDGDDDKAFGLFPPRFYYSVATTPPIANEGDEKINNYISSPTAPTTPPRKVSAESPITPVRQRRRSGALSFTSVSAFFSGPPSTGVETVTRASDDLAVSQGSATGSDGNTIINSTGSTEADDVDYHGVLLTPPMSPLGHKSKGKVIIRCLDEYISFKVKRAERNVRFAPYNPKDRSRTRFRSRSAQV